MPWASLLTSSLRLRSAIRHWKALSFSLIGAEVGPHVSALTTGALFVMAERPSLLKPTRSSSILMAFKPEQGHRSPFHRRYVRSRSSQSQDFDNRYLFRCRDGVFTESWVAPMPKLTSTADGDRCCQKRAGVAIPGYPSADEFPIPHPET